jgi:hypothetical protein
MIAIVAVAILFAIVMIPLTIRYYMWLARHVAPRLTGLPFPIGMTIIALWVFCPWGVLALVLWMIQR